MQQSDWMQEKPVVALATVIRTMIQMTMDLTNLPSYLEDNHARLVQEDILHILSAIKVRLLVLIECRKPRKQKKMHLDS